MVAIAALVIGQDLVELPADLTFSCDGKNNFYFKIPFNFYIKISKNHFSKIKTNSMKTILGRAYGYYADPATNCQVFHICLGDGDIKWSFLCPNQTIFNQVKFMIIYRVSHSKVNKVILLWLNVSRMSPKLMRT